MNRKRIGDDWEKRSVEITDPKLLESLRLSPQAVEAIERIEAAARRPRQRFLVGQALPEIRPMVIPEFTDEQIAHLEARRRALNSPQPMERVGGRFTGPWPRYR